MAVDAFGVVGGDVVEVGAVSVKQSVVAAALDVQQGDVASGSPSSGSLTSMWSSERWIVWRSSEVTAMIVIPGWSNSGSR